MFSNTSLRSWVLGISAISLAAGASWAQSASPFKFEDVTASAGIKFQHVGGAVGKEKGWLVEALGAGAAWLDYDGDGNLDLFLVNGSSFERGANEGEPNQLYRGDGKGRFTEVGKKAKVDHRGWGSGAAAADFDNDGDTDLFVTNFGANVLYENQGNGTFKDITKLAGVAGTHYSSSAAWFDYDSDGDLDLYVANYMVADPKRVARLGTPEASDCQYKGIDVACGPLGQVPEPDFLYRNDGGGKFTDVTAKAGMRLDRPRYSLGVVGGDIDNDGDIDLYVANDSVQNSMWRNNGDGTFADIGVASLAALNTDGQAQAGMGTDMGDFNGDGWIDIVVTNFAHDLNTVYRNMAGKLFIDDSSVAGMSVTFLSLSWGTGWLDFDSDGDLDLFIANGHVYPHVEGYSIGTEYEQRNHLFENTGKRLQEVGEKSGPGMALERSFRGAAFADYDNDGDYDILTTALDGQPALLRNDAAKSGNWIRFELVGNKSNRDAVGASVRMSADGITIARQRTAGGSYLSSNDPRLLVGVGSAKKIARVEIRWPDGSVQTLTDLAVNTTHRVEQAK